MGPGIGILALVPCPWSEGWSQNKNRGSEGLLWPPCRLGPVGQVDGEEVTGLRSLPGAGDVASSGILPLPHLW